MPRTPPTRASRFTRTPAARPPPAGGAAVSRRPRQDRGPPAVRLGRRGARARAAHTLPAAQERAIVATAHADHVAIRPAIESLGGRVVAEYHHALNGVAVLIERGQVASLAALPGVRSVHHVNTYHLSNAVERAVYRRTGGLARPPAAEGRGRQDRDHRHRHRLHARRLRRAGHGGGLRGRRGDQHAAGRPGAVRAERAEGQGRHSTSSATPTTPAIPTQRAGARTRTRSTATATAATWPARRPASASPAAPTYPGPTTPSAYTTTQFDIGPGVAPKADLYAVRVFGCIGFDQRRHRGDRLGGREPHGRHQHVARLAVRHRRLAPTRWPPTTRPRPASAWSRPPATTARRRYIASTPASGTHVLAAAAMDARATFAAASAHRARAVRRDRAGVEADSAPLPLGGVRSSCSATARRSRSAAAQRDYPAGGAAGALVIVSRGTCSFVAKAALAAGRTAPRRSASSTTPPATSSRRRDPGRDDPVHRAAASLTRPTVAGRRRGPDRDAARRRTSPTPPSRRAPRFSSGGPALRRQPASSRTSARRASRSSRSRVRHRQRRRRRERHVDGDAARRGRRGADARRRTAVARALRSRRRSSRPPTPACWSAHDPRLTGAGVIQPLGSTRPQVVAVDERRQRLAVLRLRGVDARLPRHAHAAGSRTTAPATPASTSATARRRPRPACRIP